MELCWNLKDIEGELKTLAWKLSWIISTINNCFSREMTHNNHQHIYNNQTNGTRTSNNNPDDITQSDAISPRFRADLNGQEVVNFCYSCKSEFTSRSVHDLMEHYSQPHDSYSSDCLYCKGKVHQYRNDTQGRQFYHDCYRSKMKYDPWVELSILWWPCMCKRRSNNPIINQKSWK